MISLEFSKIGDRFNYCSRFNGGDRFEARLKGFKKFLKIGDRFNYCSRFNGRDRFEA